MREQIREHGDKIAVQQNMSLSNFTVAIAPMVLIEIVTRIVYLNQPYF